MRLSSVVLGNNNGPLIEMIIVPVCVSLQAQSIAADC